MEDDSKDKEKESILEPKETPEEDSGEEKEHPRNLMIYIPVAVFVVIIVAVGVARMRSKNDNQLTTQQTEEQSIFREGALPERKNVILITDFSESDSINVDYVLFENPGFVVIHDDVEGKPGNVIGKSELISSGEAEGIEVTLGRRLAKDEIIYAILHTDNGNGEFEFPEDDAPIMDENQNIIMTMFKVTAEKDIEEVTESEENL